MLLNKFVLGALLLVSAPSFAQQDKLEIEGIQVPQEVELLELAGKLVRYGQETKSALPLIQAVQIFRQLNVVDGNTDSLQADPSPYESHLLTEAINYANGNKDLLNLINDLNKVTRAGVDPGPIRYISSIAPKEVIERSFFSKQGKYVRVLLDGQGEGIREKGRDDKVLVSDLHLTVLDKNGHVIATDHSMGENCSVSFISRFTSTKTVEIENVGDLSDNYVLYIYCN